MRQSIVQFAALQCMVKRRKRERRLLHDSGRWMMRRRSNSIYILLLTTFTRPMIASSHSLSLTVSECDSGPEFFLLLLAVHLLWVKCFNDDDRTNNTLFIESGQRDLLT